MDSGVKKNQEEIDRESVELLVNIGVKRNIAKILVFLTRSQKATSREIEKMTDLRQPEVSIAIGQMLKHKWVISKENKTENKGRPVKVYEPAVPVKALLDKFEKEKRSEIDKVLFDIQKLRQNLS